MQSSVRILVLFAIAAFCSTGLAQVYETKDDEGHPVFSGVPTEGAVPVEVQPTNRADSVEPRPPAPAAPAASGNEAAPARGTAEYEQKIEREMEAYRREQAERERERHSEKRREVGHDASERRHEVGHDASEKRHEVGDNADMRRREE